MTCGEVITHLEREGGSLSRQNGSYRVYRHDEEGGHRGGRAALDGKQSAAGIAVEHRKAGGLEGTMKSYTVVVEDAGDGTWSAYVPDLPGCTAGGESAEEARESIETSIQLWIEETLAQGAKVPAPRTQSFSVAVAA